MSANIELAPALANAQASASKQTPQLRPRAALSALCLSCLGKSDQILNLRFKDLNANSGDISSISNVFKDLNKFGFN